MGEEKAVEPREILRRTRVETIPYLRELAGHRRALLPRMEIARRWIEYYGALSGTRPLSPAETRRLEGHLKGLALASSRIEVLRAAGRYSRTKKPTDLLALRQRRNAIMRRKLRRCHLRSRRKLERNLFPPKKCTMKWLTFKRILQKSVSV